MDGYDYLAGFLLLFVFFIYITWFGFSVKVENQKDQPEKISINPYDQVPLHRKNAIIPKKNMKIILNKKPLGSIMINSSEKIYNNNPENWNYKKRIYIRPYVKDSWNPNRIL